MDNRSSTTGEKFSRSVSVLSWAYNEEQNIVEFLERISRLMDASVEDYEIVLVDDGSTDRTNELATAFQKVNPRLKVYRNEINLNVGRSAIRAISLASKEYLFWQTVDWSYDISNLRTFLEYLKTYDVVLGVRRKPVEVPVKLLKPLVALLKLFGMVHLTKRSDTVSKAAVSVVNYLLIRMLFRVPLSDFQNVVFYQTDWVQSIQCESSSSFLNPELLIKSYWSGKSIKEVPISFIARKQGEAKGTKLSAIASAVEDIVRLWLRWAVLRKCPYSGKGKIYRLKPKEWKNVT